MAAESARGRLENFVREYADFGGTRRQLRNVIMALPNNFTLRGITFNAITDIHMLALPDGGVPGVAGPEAEFNVVDAA